MLVPEPPSDGSINPPGSGKTFFNSDQLQPGGPLVANDQRPCCSTLQKALGKDDSSIEKTALDG
jgi:hypothetical protein